MSEARAPIFSHPLNLLLLMSGALSAAWTLDWRPLAVAVGAELVWAVLGRRLESRRSQAARRMTVDADEQAQVRSLSEHWRRRFLELDTLRSDIRRLAEANPALESVGIDGDLRKVDRIVEGWLRLASSASHTRAIVDETDLDALRHEVESEGSARAGRLAEAEAALHAVESSEAQLARVEDSLRSLRDRVVSMASPSSLDDALEELLRGVGAAERAVADLTALESSAATGRRAHAATTAVAR